MNVRPQVVPGAVDALPDRHARLALGPELDFARSGGPAGDEQKALEEAGGDFRALRVGP